LTEHNGTNFTSVHPVAAKIFAWIAIKAKDIGRQGICLKKAPHAKKGMSFQSQAENAQKTGPR
jgi:hypothetical protein